jgi:NAD(P)-dependent dehydrogenase (short-subunit alcohol dehydrogenase family)
MTLENKTVLIVGRGSGIARAIALAALNAGADVVAAGRRVPALEAAYAGEPRVRTALVDLTDDASIDALAARVGHVDHVVSTASARAKGTLGDLTRDAVGRSLDAKVVGPLMLARAFSGRIRPGGSLLLCSGSTASRFEAGMLAVAVTNGAVDTLTRSLAVELAPIRVNAIAPGTVDSGAWDGLGEAGRAALFERLAARNPAGRIGTVEDVAQAAILALTNTFITGAVIPVDGGQRLT